MLRDVHLRYIHCQDKEIYICYILMTKRYSSALHSWQRDIQDKEIFICYVKRPSPPSKELRGRVVVRASVSGQLPAIFPISILGFHFVQLYCFMYFWIDMNNTKMIPFTALWNSNWLRFYDCSKLVKNRPMYLHITLGYSLLKCIDNYVDAA